VTPVTPVTPVTRTTPDGVVAVEVLADDGLEGAVAQLHPDERAVADGHGPARRRDFVAGRRALRAALAVLAIEPTAPLLRDDRGAPILPAGVVGSISHKRERAVALVARADGATRGVDLERLGGGSAVDISAKILTARELAAIAGLTGEARTRAVRIRFALKEAIYKAVDPYVRRYVGFTEVEVELDPVAMVAEVEILDPARLPVRAVARWQELEGHVLATARGWAR
jgi:4'-phosphopantetheinyl transferase EntD